MKDEETPRLPRDLKRRLGRKDARSADALADALLRTRPALFSSLPLDPVLRDALTALRAMRVEKERARQLRYVQRLVRECDRAPIEAALEGAEHDADEELRQRRITKLAEALLERGDEAIGEALEAHPTLDRTTLRNLTRNVAKAKEAELPKARRALSTYLRSVLVAEEG